MWHISRTALIGLLATILGIAALACGSSDEELVSQRDYEQEGLESSRAQLAMDRPSYLAPVDAFREVVEEVTVSGEPGMPGLPGNPGAPGVPRPAPAPIPRPASASAPAPTAAAMPAPRAAPSQMSPVTPTPAPAMAAPTPGGESGQTQAQLVAQRRIIIREVDMDLVVDDIQASMDRIAEMAASAGGWVVDSGRMSLHGGRISVRVPADQLDATIANLRRIASKVRSELTTSRDVTDEYVDLGARLKNQRATEEALLSLLERAQSVEAALAVQRDLTQVQEAIERISGRIKFLEETSAFSIIRVKLSLAPADIAVDGGPDQTVAVHFPVRFRATFSPPDGIEDYTITWDPGDGSEPVRVHRTAPTQVTGQLITATVTHFYNDPTGSPFIAQVTITGTGEGGIVEGVDTLTVSVSEVPAIEVFAGERKVVKQNTEVEFSGSFTRPKGLANVRFEWDFGDGSTPTEGDLPEGVTRAEATHVYPDHRRQPYVARLTVSADSEIGEVGASGEINVFVNEQVGFVVGGFDLGGNFKTAVRGFTAFVQILSVVVMWLVIFIPFWGVVAVLVWLLIRKQRRVSAEHRARLAAQQQAAAQQMAEAGQQSAGDSG